MKGGDMSTKFFHNQCKERQRRNTLIELIKDNGEKVIDQGEINEEVISYFEKLHCEMEEVSQEELERMSKDIPSLTTNKDNEILNLGRGGSQGSLVSSSS